MPWRRIMSSGPMLFSAFWITLNSSSSFSCWIESASMWIRRRTANKEKQRFLLIKKACAHLSAGFLITSSQACWINSLLLSCGLFGFHLVAAWFVRNFKLIQLFPLPFCQTLRLELAGEIWLGPELLFIAVPSSCLQSEVRVSQMWTRQGH